jgi:hypothetical protein
MKTKEDGIEDAGLAETTGILRPQRTGPQNDRSPKVSASNRNDGKLDKCHKVRGGPRSIKNSRNEAGMSMKTKDDRIHTEEGSSSQFSVPLCLCGESLSTNSSRASEGY